MTFTQAIESGFRNYVNFSGRAARSEYWLWALFVLLAGLAAMFVDHNFFLASIVHDKHITYGPVTLIFKLAVFLPGMAVMIRRLHDIDKSGWWWLIVFIPLIGAIVLVVFFCRRGTDGPNRFGSDPLMFTSLPA